MKESNYNFFYEVEDGLLAYNVKTNAMAVVEEEKVEELKRILQGKPSEDKKFIEELTYGGFLVEDDTDELKELRHEMYASRFSNNALNLTIAPTSDCNFRCFYCYEKDVLHTQRMQDETAEKLVKFVEEKAKGIEHLSVNWYGGEPMLEYHRICELSERFMNICEKYDVAYDAAMVSNGYLLTADKLEKLISYKVSSIQITLDGMKETHDSRRYLKNHGGTFDKIIENLKSFETLAKENKSFPEITIRMNIDKRNKEEAFELLELIAASELKTYVIPYVAGVYDNKDIEHKETLTDSEYTELKNKFIEKMEEKGFGVDYLAYYPQRVTSQCCCDRIDSLVVDAHGNLYKCWEEIGDEKACVGQIGTEKVYNLPQSYYSYLLNDPTLKEDCIRCRILPVCMGGGCPLRRERDGRRNCAHEQKIFEENVVKSIQKLGKTQVKKIALG